MYIILFPFVPLLFVSYKFTEDTGRKVKKGGFVGRKREKEERDHLFSFADLGLFLQEREKQDIKVLK